MEHSQIAPPCGRSATISLSGLEPLFNRSLFINFSELLSEPRDRLKAIWGKQFRAFCVVAVG